MKGRRAMMEKNGKTAVKWTSGHQFAKNVN
jgi:hypothetical protein